MFIRNFNAQFLSQNKEDDLIKKSNLIKTNKYIMGAITSRGTNPRRKQNLDHSLIITHPKNEDLSMMLIVDGKDDIENSSIAAQITIEKLCLWFKRLSKMQINTAVLLESLLLGELRKINLDLYRYYNPAEVSFALAIKGKKDTFIANIGNCRAYTIKDNNITLQTTDNLAWYNHNDQNSITPDEVKFLVGKDYVSRTIGGHDNSKQYFMPYTKNIENSEYDSLILTTHGITDVLDSSDLLYYSKTNDIEETLDNIINKAIYGVSTPLPEYLLEKFKKQHKEYMLLQKTIPGDSNATAIVLKKTKNS